MKRVSLAAVLLAVLFLLFFQASKHTPFLAQANPFSEDPFDAVDSFGVQLAAVSALLLALRLLRPYLAGSTVLRREMVLRSAAGVFSAISASMAANLLAMLRYRSMWTAQPAGWLLLAVVAVLLAASLLGLRSVAGQVAAPARRPWMAAAAAWLTGLAVLSIYPDRNSITGVPGAFLAALTGLLIFYLMSCSVARLIFPPLTGWYADLLDDLASFLPIHPLLKRLHWLNPRRHPWRWVVLLGLAGAAALLAAEFLMEGAPQRRQVLTIISIFAGLELLGVLLGYVLFRSYLGLFRPESSHPSPTR